MKYKQLKDYNFIKLDPKGEIFNFKCCDCGLVHLFCVAIEEDGKIGFAIRRDSKKTANARLKMKNDELWEKMKVYGDMHG